MWLPVSPYTFSRFDTAAALVTPRVYYARLANFSTVTWTQIIAQLPQNNPNFYDRQKGLTVTSVSSTSVSRKTKTFATCSISQHGQPNAPTGSPHGHWPTTTQWVLLGPLAGTPAKPWTTGVTPAHPWG